MMIALDLGNCYSSRETETKEYVFNRYQYINILKTTYYCGVVEVIRMAFVQMMKGNLVAAVVLAVTAMMLRSEAQLNPLESAALFDLCDRPGTDLWANCSDVANACINRANWSGITCDASNTSIVVMYD